MKMVILTQAGSNVGLGHFYRSLALASLLLHDYKISLRNLVADDLLDLSTLVDERISYKQYSSMEEILSENFSHDFVIYDGKFLNSTEMFNLKKKSFGLLVVDDNHNFEISADIIINHNLHAKNLGYEKYPDTKSYLGPEFSLIRKSFLLEKGTYKVREDLSSVTISLGGGDPENWTSKIYHFLKKNKTIKEISLIVGKANPNLSSLKEEILNTSDKILFNLSDTEMVELYKKSDLLVCSASTTFIEGLILGVPMLVGAFAEDQLKLLEEIKKNRVGVSVGNCFGKNDFDKSDIEKLNNSGFRAELNQNCKFLVGKTGYDLLLNDFKLLCLNCDV